MLKPTNRQAGSTVSPRVTAARIALLYLVFAILWIYTSDRVLGMLVQDKQWLEWLGTVKGMAYVIVTALLLYILLRNWSYKEEVKWGASATIGKSWLVVVSLFLILVVPLIGYSLARVEGPRIRDQAFKDLSAVARLKTDQIEQWLVERRGDAEVLKASTGFGKAVELWLRTGNPDARVEIDQRLQALRHAFNYRTELIDIRARLDDPARQALLASALSTGRPQMGELYKDTRGTWLDLIVPLVSMEAGKQRVIAVAMLSAKADDFLFPFIQTWPTPSPSAETLLVRRDGNSVLFLNELRHRKNTSMNLRLPLDSQTLPAAVAIRTGKPSIFEGLDYRGVRVLSALRPIIGTNWFLVAKVERDEVMRPLHNLIAWISLLSIAAIISLAIALVLLWRQQERSQRLELLAQTAEKDRLLKLFYDLPFIGMAILSPVTRHWLHVNDRLCDMLGYTHEELLDSSWEKLTHPNDRAANKALFQQVMASKTGIHHMDKRFVRKDGSIVDTALDVTNVLNNEGAVEYIVTMVQDVTERKRSEAALRASEERYRLLVEQSADGIFVSDAQGHYIDVNSAGCRMLGYTREELLERSIADIIRPDEISRIGLEVARFAGNAITTSEWMFLRKDGSTFPGEVHGRQLPDGRLQAILRDITERKAAERALIEKQADLNRAQMVGHIGSWRLDVRRNELTWSEENHRIFEVPEGTPMTYEFFLSTVHPDDRAYVDREWQASLQGKPYDIEHRLLLNGRIKWVREKAELEFDEEGKLLGGFGTTQDITDRKLAEEALLEADQRKNDFITLLAHELRNPMAVTATAAFLLQSKGLADPGICRWAASTIGNQTQLLKQLVDDLLDVERVNRGRIALIKTHFDLSQLVERVAKEREALFEQRKQHFILHANTEPLWINGDPGRMTQVISNLLDNACKFTPENGHIALSLMREGNQAVIRISDTGRGISPSLLPHVFEVFTQGQVSIARDEGGLGLGLALVKGLVELHGGQVSATSAGSGKGAEFTVRLPALAEVKQPVADRNKSEERITSRRHILIADDNAMAIEGLRQVLEDAGHLVRAAADGEEALSSANDKIPEVAILDIGLPKMDGYELARRLRKLPDGDSLLLIALTGYGQESDRLQAKEAGFDYHLTKPADLVQLLEIINHWSPAEQT